jgi:hypothetical protein
VSSVAAASLVVGFAVAQGTGVRALGGVVLVVAAAVCARQWRRRSGARTAVALVGVYLAAFVLSHVLALAVGAWPSVVTVAVVVGAVSLAVSSREHAPAR